LSVLKEQPQREERETEVYAQKGLFTSASTQVVDSHLKSLLTMLALDEEQHYAMLRYILEDFVKKEELNA
jgi:hypothetical protein